MKSFIKISIIIGCLIFTINGFSGTIKGGGATSCAYFLQTNQQSNAMMGMWRQWITGFISGRNYELDLSKGKDVDEDAFVYEVRNFCQREPMKKVVDAVVWLYDNKL